MKNSKNRTAVLAIVAILGLNIHVNAQDRPKKPEAPSKEQAFKNLDSDKDGKISKAEFTSHAEERFAKMDKNGDGFINMEEMQSSDPGQKRPEPEAMMKNLDANSDGFIDENEAKGPLKMHFADIDANGDKKLSVEELSQQKGPARGKRPERRKN